MANTIPRIAIIDDLFGRELPNGTNEDRENLCAAFFLKDVTNERENSRQKIKKPIAEAIFCRGQIPACATHGQTVENDLPGTMDFIRRGWIGDGPGFKRWSLLLLDLCFYTGAVTGTLSQAVAGTLDKRAEHGMPEGRAGDIVPSQFFGLQLLRAIHTEFPDLPVVILSSQDRGKVSQQFSAHGALAFLPRSNDEDGEELLRTYLDRHGLIEDPLGLIVGRSLSLLKALRAARRTAYNEGRENILIRGERGVGKEEFAKFIHRVHPSRAVNSLVAVNSAVLTSELYSSELFGIEKRVATEVNQRDGQVLLAQNGDLFFDEVKDMIPQAQAGILRLLEEGRFNPVGGSKAIESNVRVISATNADLESLAASGRFREDLLDRLRRGGSIILPPLRERKEDIPFLARAFANAVDSGNHPVEFQRQISEEGLACLKSEEWPGNIRTLRDVIQKVVKDNDVEHIYPAQIEKAKRDLGLDLGKATSVTTSTSISPQKNGPRLSAPITNVEPSTATKTPTLNGLIDTMRRFEFDPQDRDSLRGKLDELDEAAARLVISYLLASLKITSDPVSGDLVITTAIQFVTGKKKLSTSSAYDMIKRLVKRHPAGKAFALENPILKQAFEQAEANRPTNRSKKQTSKEQ